MPSYKYRYEAELSNSQVVEFEIVAEDEAARDAHAKHLVTNTKDGESFFKDLVSGKNVNKNHIVTYNLKA